MNYFETLPKVTTIDYNGNNILMTNLMVRSEILPSLLKNPLLFYSYDIQDGDSPEIIATKYYDNPYRYWIVLFANQMIDPQWDWPMNSSVFGSYIKNKYTSDCATFYNVSESSVTSAQILSYTQGQIKYYVKSISTVDNSTNKKNILNYRIDFDEYQSTQENTIVKTFTTGAQVTQTVSKYTESYYDYEMNLNESRRSIYLVNAIYVSEFELQFYNLMKM
jgi:hypothetical protein